MKKIFYYLILILLIIGIAVFSFKKKEVTNKTKISLGEVTHSVFYVPLYVAIENDYFGEENIDLELVLTPGADKVSAAVLSGDVQIGFAGAESAIYVYKQGEKDYLQIFSGLTKRDGQFIISRNKEDNFSLENLYGKEILVGRKSGMPALNFLNALKKENIDPKKININHAIEFASLSGAFIGKTGDYVDLYEPNALALEKQGYGHVVASIGKLSGEMPYTTFYARKSFIKDNQDLIERFNNAIQKGLDYTFSHSAKEIAKVIYNQFPDTSLNDLEIIVQRYIDNDSWLKTTNVEEKLLENLEDIMIDNNLLDKYVPYKDIVVSYAKNN